MKNWIATSFAIIALFSSGAAMADAMDKQRTKELAASVVAIKQASSVKVSCTDSYPH